MSRFGVDVSRNDGFNWGYAKFELRPHISVDSQEDVREMILRLGLKEQGSPGSLGIIYSEWWVIFKSRRCHPRRVYVFTGQGLNLVNLIP